MKVIILLSTLSTWISLRGAASSWEERIPENRPLHTSPPVNSLSQLSSSALGKTESFSKSEVRKRLSKVVQLQFNLGHTFTSKNCSLYCMTIGPDKKYNGCIFTTTMPGIETGILSFKKSNKQILLFSQVDLALGYAASIDMKPLCEIDTLFDSLNSVCQGRVDVREIRNSSLSYVEAALQGPEPDEILHAMLQDMSDRNEPLNMHNFYGSRIEVDGDGYACEIRINDWLNSALINVHCDKNGNYAIVENGGDKARNPLLRRNTRSPNRGSLQGGFGASSDRGNPRANPPQETGTTWPTGTGRASSRQRGQNRSTSVGRASQTPIWGSSATERERLERARLEEAYQKGLKDGKEEQEKERIRLEEAYQKGLRDGKEEQEKERARLEAYHKGLRDAQQQQLIQMYPAGPTPVPFGFVPIPDTMGYTPEIVNPPGVWGQNQCVVGGSVSTVYPYFNEGYPQVPGEMQGQIQGPASTTWGSTSLYTQQIDPNLSGDVWTQPYPLQCPTSLVPVTPVVGVVGAFSQSCGVAGDSSQNVSTAGGALLGVAPSISQMPPAFERFPHTGTPLFPEGTFAGSAASSSEVRSGMKKPVLGPYVPSMTNEVGQASYSGGYFSHQTTDSASSSGEDPLRIRPTSPDSLEKKLARKVLEELELKSFLAQGRTATLVTESVSSSGATSSGIHPSEHKPNTKGEPLERELLRILCEEISKPGKTADESAPSSLNTNAQTIDLPPPVELTHPEEMDTASEVAPTSPRSSGENNASPNEGKRTKRRVNVPRKPLPKILEEEEEVLESDSDFTIGNESDSTIVNKGKNAAVVARLKTQPDLQSAKPVRLAWADVSDDNDSDNDFKSYATPMTYLKVSQEEEKQKIKDHLQQVPFSDLIIKLSEEDQSYFQRTLGIEDYSIIQRVIYYIKQEIGMHCSEFTFECTDTRPSMISGEKGFMTYLQDNQSKNRYHFVYSADKKSLTFFSNLEVANKYCEELGIKNQLVFSPNRSHRGDAGKWEKGKTWRGEERTPKVCGEEDKNEANYKQLDPAPWKGPVDWSRLSASSSETTRKEKEYSWDKSSWDKSSWGESSWGESSWGESTGGKWTKRSESYEKKQQSQNRSSTDASVRRNKWVGEKS